MKLRNYTSEQIDRAVTHMFDIRQLSLADFMSDNGQKT